MVRSRIGAPVAAGRILAVIAGAALSGLPAPAHARCQDAPGPQVNWGGCSKVQLMLSGTDFSGAVLSRATLTGGDFSRTVLAGARLEAAEISRVRFDAANLAGADLSRAI